MRAALTGLGLLVATSAIAQLPAPLQVVPLAGVPPGGTGTYRTEVVVANLAQRPATVGVRVMPGGGGSLAAGFPITRTLGPGEAASIGEPVDRALAGGRGWLLVADATPVDCDAAYRPFPAPLAVSARLMRGDLPASPGLVVPASWLAVNLSDLPSRLLPVRHGSGVRAFVVVTSVASVPLTVEVAALELGGRRIGWSRRTLPPLGLAVWELGELGLVVPAERPFAIEVSRTGEPAWDACRVLAAPPPCLEACQPKRCPGGLRLPAFPAFVALLAEVDAATGEAQLLQPVIDHAAAIAAANRFSERHCPDSGGSGRLVDLMDRLLMRRDHSASP